MADIEGFPLCAVMVYVDENHLAEKPALHEGERRG